MINANPLADPHVNFSKYTKIDKPVDQQHYPSITRSLSYAALGTRPDIANVVANLARYNTYLRSLHITAAKRVLRYLKKTKHLQLRFDPPDNTSLLIGYTDADREITLETVHQ